MTAIDVRDLTVRYGSITALDDASLRVEAGRVCGLLGVNGAGKSTLFKALLGATPIHSGRIRLLGKSPAQARRSGTTAYVPQNEAIDHDFPVSVRDVVATGRYTQLGLTRRLKSADHEAIDQALDRVGLSEQQGRQIGQLSGGQRKRTFVARALAQEARIVLLDEPFAGVDRTSEQRLISVIRELAANGKTILIATHDLHQVPALCDEAVLLMRRVLLHDSPEVVTRPENLARAFGADTA